MTSRDEPTLDLALSLEAASESAGDRVAIRGDAGSTTYRALFEALAPDARRLAARARGLARPAVWLTLGADEASVRAILRCLEAGVPFAAAHPRWTPAESEARRAALAGLALIARDEREGDAPASDREPRRPPSPDDPLAFVFTSGSTGAPSPVVLSRRAFVASALASRSAIPLRADDRWMLSMPLAHVGGLGIVVRCLVARASIVLDPGPFDPRTFVERIARHEVTHASVVPTMLKRLVDATHPCPSSLRALVVGGAACDPILAKRALELGYPVRRTYGMTETCAMVAVESAPLQGGVGHALLGIELRAGTSGLEVRGPTLADGRFVDGRVVPLPKDEDGWFRTGDLGRVAPTGIVHVDGRRDEVVVTGGENVHPAEVEAALCAIDDVDAAVVFGIEDPEWGAAVVAAIASRSPHCDAATLDARLRDRLAGFKRPRAYAIDEALPLLSNGKVDRVRTRAWARAHLVRIR